MVDVKHISEDDEYLSERQAAEVLRVGSSTLAKWRITGTGPKYLKLSPKILRYTRRHLREFAAASVRTSTTEARDG